MEKVEILNKISKISIYLLVFLIPIFFLPFTQNVLDYQKQFLLLFLVSLSLVCQLIKFLIEEKISFNFHPLHFLILAVILIFGLSTLFSQSRTESFFGFPLTVSQSFLTLLFLSILYFLIVSIFEKKEIFYLLLSFLMSVFLATLFSTAQLFGKFIFPFDFSKQTSFNTIGTQNSLAILLVCLLPLALILFSISKKLIKVFFLILIFVSLFFLLLLNFKSSFFILLIFSAIFLGFLLTKREIFSPTLLVLSLLFLSISVSFFFFSFRIFLIQIPLEVSLAQNFSFEIALKSIKERPILGSGPATFLYQFSKYKGTDLNNSAFWNSRFLNSASKFLDIFSTTGILGTISFLSLTFFPIYFGFLKIFKEKLEKFYLLLFSAIFLSVLNLSLSFFLYFSSLTNEFSYFFLLACFVNLLGGKKEEILLKGESIFRFLFSLFFVLIFITDFAILIKISQRYIGEVYYWKAIRAWQRGNVDQTIFNLEKAISFSKVDLYFRDLSQAYLSKLKEKIQIGNQDIQTEAAQAVNLSKTAIDLNPVNVANWSVRAFSYQSLTGIVSGADDWAIKCYDQALKLEPSNPFYFTQKGILVLGKGILSQNEKEKENFFVQAEDLFKKAIELKSDYAPAHFQLAMVYYNKGNLDDAISKMEETKNLAPFDVGLAFQLGVAYYQKGDYQRAKEELERAILITPDYANALYFLGLTYDQLGEKGKAIEKFKKVSELNPDNEEVKKIISNLESGKKALEGILPTVPPLTPLEENPPEIKR
jgi:tetratricopeptide (TPR) repeat protein/O-antigen ligase